MTQNHAQTVLTVLTVVVAILHTAGTVAHSRNCSTTSQLAQLHTTMKILQLNARSLNTSSDLINDYAKARDVDIIAISETWEPKEISPSLNSYFKPRTNDFHGGVAIFSRKTLKMIPRMLKI